MSGAKYLFDLSGEINKFLRSLKDDLGTWIVTAKTCDGVLRLAEKNKKYDVFSSEAAFKKHGGKITDALKKAGAEYSVTLFSEGASGKFAAAARFLTGDVIALGDKNFILSAAAYAKISGKSCYAVLTEPDFDGLFAAKGVACDKNAGEKTVGGKSADGKNADGKSADGKNALKAVVIDPEILVKGAVARFPEAYAFAALKTLDLIDYKLSVILKEKPFDEFYFSKARFLSALLKNAFKFSNYLEVILYVTLLTGVVSALSEVFTGGGGERLKKAFIAEYSDLSVSDCALYALIVGANAYHLTFSNDLTVGILAENVNADISAAAKLFGGGEKAYRKNLKAYSPAEIKAVFRAVNGARGKLLADSGEILTSLKDYIAGYETLSGKKFDAANFSYEKTKEAVKISFCVDSGVTALNLLTYAGVFAAAK